MVQQYQFGLSLYYGTNHKPKVRCEGRGPSVVVRHEAEAFDEGTTMVLCGEPFAKIIGEDKACVEETQTALFCPLHDADAPVVVGRVAIDKIVGRTLGNVGADIETLVADEHTLEEGFGGQLLGSLQTAVAEKVPLVVHPVGLTIDYGIIPG